MSDETMVDTEARTRCKRLDRRLRQQQQQILELKEELHETRRLHRRVAELADVLAELLVPALDRDDERVRAALADLDRAGRDA